MAIHNRDMRQLVSTIRVQMSPSANNIGMMMDVRSREKVSEHIVNTSAMLGIDRNVAVDCDRIYLAEETGKSLTPCGLPIQNVDIRLVVHEEQYAAVAED
jgi:hypothetical protein